MTMMLFMPTFRWAKTKHLYGLLVVVHAGASPVKVVPVQLEREAGSAWGAVDGHTLLQEPPSPHPGKLRLSAAEVKLRLPEAEAKLRRLPLKLVMMTPDGKLSLRLSFAGLSERRFDGPLFLGRRLAANPGAGLVRGLTVDAVGRGLAARLELPVPSGHR